MAHVTDDPNGTPLLSPEAPFAGDPVQPDPAAAQDATDETAVSADEESREVSTGAATPEETVVPEHTDIAEDLGVPTKPEVPDEESFGDAPEIESRKAEDALFRVDSDRTQEVPALLGMSAMSNNEEPAVMADNRDVPDEAAAATDEVLAEDEVEAAVIVAEPDERNATDDQDVPMPAAEPEEKHSPEQLDVGTDLKRILESLQDSLADTHDISLKLDAVSNDTDDLAKKIADLSLQYEMLSTELAANASNVKTKNVLSKTFLTCSSLIIFVLAAFQIYTFMLLVKTQRAQNVEGSAVLETIGNLNKKMADYNKNITKVLEKPVQQEHAQSSPVATEIAVHEPQGTSSASVTPVNEKLNKLRNGLPEKKLFRKETGDWFVYNKKNDECISDVEIIDSLNQAYRKIGRSVSPVVPLPAHKALCVLKPDGKGGTQVVMTTEFLP